MSLEETTNTASSTAAPTVKMEQDTTMTDASVPQLQPEIPTSHTGPTTTMPRQSDTNGTTNDTSSVAMPKEAAHHGAPTRDWINTKVTGVLLDGMKLLATERPEAPLKALGEYILKRSAEMEGTGGGGNGASGQ